MNKYFTANKVLIKYLFMLFCFFSCFLTMSILRYVSLHSCFFDMGIYENKIWRIAFNGELRLIFNGHFSPILLIHALFYRIFPSGETLLVLQAMVVTLGSYPLFLIAKNRLGDKYALLVAFSYFCYFSVEYNILFDFHVDHIIIPVIFFAIFFLESGNPLCFSFLCLLGLTIKESLNLTIMMLGIYSAIKYKYHKNGFIIGAVSIVLFIFDSTYIVPYFSNGVDLISMVLPQHGSSFTSIVIDIISKPNLWLSAFITKSTLKYLLYLLAPLLFIPLLSPSAMVIALPVLIINIFPDADLLKSLQSHYHAGVIPVIFIAFVYGIEKVKYISILPTSIISAALFFNIFLSPSPISRLFLKNELIDFAHNSYMPSERDNIIKEMVTKYIPDSKWISVVSQNSLNYVYLAQRIDYQPFPANIEKADFILVDTKRPPFIYDKVNQKEYNYFIKRIEAIRENVWRFDGMAIYGKTLECNCAN